MEALLNNTTELLCLSVFIWQSKNTHESGKYFTLNDFHTYIKVPINILTHTSAFHCDLFISREGGPVPSSYWVGRLNADYRQSGHVDETKPSCWKLNSGHQAVSLLNELCTEREIVSVGQMFLTNCKSAVRDLWLCIFISVLSTTYGISLNIITILPACVSNVCICIYCQMVKIIEDMCIIVSVHIQRCSTLFFIKPGVGQMLQLQHTLQLWTNKLSSDNDLGCDAV
jgi:hypothetical protein